MPTLENVDPQYAYALFKGEPGTRKSTAALSYPGPQYWFSWDRKMEGLLLPMKHWGIDPKSVSYDDYQNWDAAKNKLEQFQLKCPYKTLVFDSITSMADMTLRQVLQSKKGSKRSSGADAGKSISGIPVNEIEDFNAESSAINELIALTKDIHQFFKVNIILIAHVIQVDHKQLDGETHVSRSLVTAAKKVAAKIPAYCGEVYHFNITREVVASRGGKYALLTEHTGQDFARTALPLDKEIQFGDDPLYTKYILPAINKLKLDTNQTKTT